jgi:hypothetical protein
VMSWAQFATWPHIQQLAGTKGSLMHGMHGLKLRGEIPLICNHLGIYSHFFRPSDFGSKPTDCWRFNAMNLQNWCVAAIQRLGLSKWEIHGNPIAKGWEHDASCNRTRGSRILWHILALWMGRIGFTLWQSEMGRENPL